MFLCIKYDELNAKVQIYRIPEKLGNKLQKNLMNK